MTICTIIEKMDEKSHFCKQREGILFVSAVLNEEENKKPTLKIHKSTLHLHITINTMCATNHSRQEFSKFNSAPGLQLLKLSHVEYYNIIYI